MERNPKGQNFGSTVGGEKHEQAMGKTYNPEEEKSDEGEFILRTGKEPMVEEATKRPLRAPYIQRLKKPLQETKSQQFLELFK